VALPNRQSFFAVIVVKSSLQKPYSLFPVFLYVRLVNDKINRVDFVLKKKKKKFLLNLPSSFDVNSLSPDEKDCGVGLN
jgi:hypothetical protein